MVVYRLLLLLYPASFRAEYGAELTSLFGMRLRGAGSGFACALLWLQTIGDVLVSAAQTQWDILRQDIRYGLRSLRRSPGFAATAVLVAALGVGATTAAYTITDHVLLRPLPFPDSERLVKLWEDMSPGGYRHMEPSPANYRDWKQMSRSFSDMAALHSDNASIVGAGDPEYVEGAAVTWNLFPMLGAHAVLGRLFDSDDDRPGASGTIVLSYGLWQQKFGAQPDVIGRRILLDGSPVVVIGVMSPQFIYPRHNVRYWRPTRFANSDFEDRNNNYLYVVARLRPGVSQARAQAEMNLIAERLRRAYPKDNEH